MNVAKQKMSKPKKKTQGELLEELYLWSGLSQQKFVDRFNKSRTWLQKNIVKKRLFRKAIPQICSAFDIPPEYFQGKYELPKRMPQNVAEHSVDYGNKIIEDLRMENDQLRSELLDLNKKYRELLEEMNSLLKRV